MMGNPELAQVIPFATNAGRVENRDALLSILKPVFLKRSASDWLAALESVGIPCGPINTLDKVFAERQVEEREMLIHMEHSRIRDLRLVGSPLKFSDTPVEYKLPPPGLGEHTEQILNEIVEK
jgi:crotonobetainyl-CoA:carnitine CoA-transferase CaiB-like acyl-CoA transferase